MKILSFIIVAICSFGYANASAITVFGDKFDVTYNQNQAIIGGFGDASTINNNIFSFSPFTAFAQTGGGVGIQAHVMTFQGLVTAHQGQTLSSIDVYAFGNAIFFSNAGVAISGQIRVVPTGTLDQMTANLQLSTPLTANAAFDFNTHNFVSHAGISFPVGVVSVDLTIQKVLVAYNNDSLSFGLISNTFDAVTIGTMAVSVVPEPTSKWLLLIGFISLAFFTNRRNCQ